MTAMRAALLPLRQLILRRAAMLVGTTGVLVAACFAAFGLLPMANQVAQSQFDHASSQVDAGLVQLFTPPLRLLAMSPGWLGGRAPDLVSPAAFNAIFQPVLEQHEAIASVVAGNAAGQGWLLLEQGGGHWRNRMTDIPRWGLNQHRLIEHDASGRVTERWSTQAYDPRLRPWYQGAMTLSSQNAVFWSAPYTFFTTGDPGITASTRMRLADGQDLVLGFDLKLLDLSRVTMGASVGAGGMALVVADDGRVLALPARPGDVSAADWQQRLLKPASALGLPAVTAALAGWNAAGRPTGEVLGFVANGVDWLVSVRPYPLGAQHLWVLVLAPKADFAADWRPIGLALAAALLLVLALVGVIMRAGTLQLTRPLERLAQASRRIGQLDFEGSVHTTSRVSEVADLAECHAHMQDTLRQNQHELDARAQQLSQQVLALRQAEASLQLQNEQLSAILDNFPGGVSVVDANGRLRSYNARFQSLLALPDSLMLQPDLSLEAIIRFCARRGDDGAVDVDNLVRERLAPLQGGAPHKYERVLANGSCIEVLGTPLPQGGFVMLYMDVTATRQHQSTLEHLAHFDALTGLPNRVLLADRLRHGMVQASRRGQQLAVAYLDLDGFKFVNDTHGHALGDQLLLVLATRMKQALREGDTLARLGGDEFVAVLLDVGGPAQCAVLLSRLLAAAELPVHLLGHALQLSVSIGVTLFPQSQEVDAEQLMRQADQAMYQAKQAGKNRYHFFDTAHDQTQRGQLEHLQRLHQALQRNEFVLYYQPKVNMRSSTVVGVEALIRWQHPDRGLLAPGEFLPLIEDHPLAVELGRWVIEAALAQLEAWQALGLALPVSINVGARQLQQSGFVDDLRTSLARHPRVNPADLQIEVLETSALEDMQRVTQVMAECRAMGVHYALDDFGTGYSSLTYLKRLPVSQLKIDRSFVHDMLDDPDDLSILVGVLDMAASFHRQVIAEGVETVAHGQMLLRLGCELAQGYGIARPMPAPDLPNWAAHWVADPSWSRVPMVARKDLPLLFASAEHRAWVQGLEAYLRGERETLVQIDAQRCNVGLWLAREAPHRAADLAAFEGIVRLHQDVHDLAARLCHLKAHNQGEAALAQLPQLRQLRDTLVAQFEALLPQV